MTMINPTIIKAVHELLQERGIEQRQNESLSDYVARGLDISAAQITQPLSNRGKDLRVPAQCNGG